MTEDNIQQAFTQYLPYIRSTIRRLTSNLPERERADAMGESLLYVWAEYRRVNALGNDPRRLISRIIEFAVKRVKAGRTASGQRAADAMHERCRYLGRSHVEAYGHMANELPDSHTWTPADRAAAKHDVALFLRRMTERDRSIALALIDGEQAKTVAEQHGLSPCRITQIRQALREDWLALTE